MLVQAGKANVCQSSYQWLFLCVIRSGASLASSQGRPSSNAAEAPQLDDYIGRHASPRRTASAQATIPLEEQHSQAQEDESTQLSRPQSGLWGVESNPSRQPSTSARAKSPPRQQNSQTDSLGSGSSPVRQRSGILRTGSSGSSLKRHESHAAPERKFLTRGPSRLRDSSTDAEGYCAAAGMGQCASGESSSEEDGRRSVPLTPGRKAKHLARQSSTEEEDERKHHRHSPRGARQRLPCHKNKHGSSGLCHHCQHPCSCQKSGAGGAGLQPQHQHHHTAEKYLSRARVQEALSPRQRPPHAHSYAAKARILDLHDNRTLAEQEQVELKGSDSPRLHSARDCRQGGAQVGSNSLHGWCTAMLCALSSLAVLWQHTMTLMLPRGLVVTDVSLVKLACQHACSQQFCLRDFRAALPDSA